MFESAEIGHAIDKETFEAEVPALREALLEAQFELQQQGRFPVIVLINGIEGAGKGETVKLLNEWMDPRLIEVRTFDQQTDEELARPPAWRYWRMLPAKGRMGIFFGNWYSQMLQGRVHGEFKDPRLDQAIAGAERLEKMLCDEGALIFKFWFHLSKKQMKARLKGLKDDPLHSWRISPLDWQQSQTYDKFVKYGERVLRRTSRDYAPWHVIEGMDSCYRSLTVGRILLDGLRQALDRPKVKPQKVGVAPLPALDGQVTLLDSLDMTLRLDKADYEEQLITEQARFAGLLRDKRMRQHALVAVFEGNDAAGKGGAIRRVAAALDPRQYSIVPIAAPTEEERAHPYMWRFWRHIPARGKFTMFDRSWYGRVLVERVEGFCSQADWLRAYGEINDFEGAGRRCRLGGGQVLAGHRQGNPAGAFPGARGHSIQALQDHRGRLAQPRQVGRLPRSGVRHGRPHEHRDFPLDIGGSQRQALGAGQGVAYSQPGAGGGFRAECKAGSQEKEGLGRWVRIRGVNDCRGRLCSGFMLDSLSTDYNNEVQPCVKW